MLWKSLMKEIIIAAAPKDLIEKLCIVIKTRTARGAKFMRDI